MSTATAAKEPRPLVPGPQQHWTLHLRDENNHAVATLVILPVLNLEVPTESYVSIGCAHKLPTDIFEPRRARKIALGRAEKLVRYYMEERLGSCTELRPLGRNGYSFRSSLCVFGYGQHLLSEIVREICSVLRHIGLDPRDVSYESRERFAQSLNAFVTRFGQVLNWRDDLPDHPSNLLKLMRGKKLDEHLEPHPDTVVGG